MGYGKGVRKMSIKSYWIVKKDRGSAEITCYKCHNSKILSAMGYLMIRDVERYCSFCGARMIGTYENIGREARTNVCKHMGNDRRAKRLEGI